MSSHLALLPYLLKEILILSHGLFVLILFIFLMVLSIPILIYRWVLSLVAKWFQQGEIGELLTPVGATLGVELLHTGKKNGHPPRGTIIATMTIDGKVSMEEAQQLLNTKWFAKTSRFPELRQYVDSWKGFLFWKDDLNFGLENHLHSHSIEGKSDAEVEANVCLFMEKLLNTPFPQKRSPWNVYIVNNYMNDDLSKQCVNGEGLTLIIFRFHHSLGDGYSVLYAILEGLLDTPLSKISLPSPKELGLESWTQKLAFPLRIFRDFSHLCSLLYSSASTPFHLPFSRGVPGRHMYERNPNPLAIQHIKSIKNMHGSSFNGVLLSGLSAAIAKTLQHLQIQKEGKSKKTTDSMSFLVPVPLQTLSSKRLRNNVTVANLELPVTPDLDPLERLRRTERGLEKAKKNTVPLILHLYLKWIGSLPTVLIKLIARNPLYPAGFTSVPGPGMEVVWKGKRGLATDFAVGLLLPGISGVGFFLLSFRNHVRIAACVEERVMSREDLKRMITHVCDEFDILFKLPPLKSSSFQQ